MKTAVAIFVKTPGLSPVKSRLAAGIGTKKAVEFYRLSCKAISELCIRLMSDVSDLDVFWAVAEQDGLDHEMWSDFPTLTQGQGGLGERLRFVHQSLCEKDYHRFAFLGGDCPHISFDDSLNLIRALNGNKGFVVGPAEDGGFWVWGQSGLRQHSEFWLNIPYSVDQTCKSLYSELLRLGELKTLATYRDVDTLSDLIHLETELSGRSQGLPAQQRLCAWIKSHKFQQDK